MAGEAQLAQATTGDPFLDPIIKDLVAKLKERFGYAGLAIGPGKAMINTSDEESGIDYIIKFEATKS